MKNILNEVPKNFEELNASGKYRCLMVDSDSLVGKNVLDIGCGFGWFELFALDKGVDLITGVEITEESLQTAKNRANFVQGSAIDLPFEDESFDTVVSWEEIEHIPKNREEKMFAEVYRVLKPGGKFYLSTPHSSFLSNLFDPAWWLIGHRHYSISKMKKFTKNNGFMLDHFEVKGGVFELLSILSLYIAKWIFRRKAFFKQRLESGIAKEYEKPKGFMTLFGIFSKPMSVTGEKQ